MKSYEDEYNVSESIEILSDEELLGILKNDLSKIFIHEIKKYPVATNESNEKYYKAYCNGDFNAREMLIKTNLKLVVTIANKYKPNVVNLQLLDLIQEGIIGLMRSLDLYDPERGAFSTYAFIEIRSAVLRAIYNKEQIIRQSVGLQVEIRHYLKLRDKYQRENKPLPSTSELCKMLGVTEENLRYIVAGAKHSVESLNMAIQEDENKELELGDVIPDSTVDKSNEIIKNMEDHDIYVVLQEILSPIQYFVVYYHILIEDKMTLDEIGKYFKVTRERIRILEEQAKEIIIKYMPTNSYQFKTILDRVKQREGKKFYQIRDEPILPIQIIKYMYMKGDLTLREQLYFLLKYLSDYKYSESDIAQFLFLKGKDYLEFVGSLKEKINNLLSDIESFREFKKHTIETYKTRIITVIQKEYFNNHVIDYAYLAKKYALYNYKHLYNRFGEVLRFLTDKEMKILVSFFDNSNLRCDNQEAGEQIDLMNDDSFNPVWEIFDKLEQKRIEVKSYGIIKKLKL